MVFVLHALLLTILLPGTTLRADVDGHIQMRAYLTGTPECKFGLNDKLVIDRGAAAGSGGGWHPNSIDAD